MREREEHGTKLVQIAALYPLFPLFFVQTQTEVANFVVVAARAIGLIERELDWIRDYLHSTLSLSLEVNTK